MQVTVTGGAGFIGSNLARELCRRGDRVVLIDDFSTGLRTNLIDIEAEVIEGSILDRQALDAAVRGSDAVVHLAARPSVPRSLEDPLASHHVNATGTLEVLEAVRRHGVAYVIVASSSSVYGANPRLPKREDQAVMPVSPYAVSKLATEGYALAYQACFGVATLALRLFNVYGPYQRADHAYAAVIPKFVAAGLAGEPLPVQGDGGQTRDFTFVDTVVDIICQAVHGRVASDGPVNLAFGGRTSLLDVARELEVILGRGLERCHTPSRVGDVRHSQADNHLLMLLFPEVQPTLLSEGLRRTVARYQEEQVAGSSMVPVAAESIRLPSINT